MSVSRWGAVTAGGVAVALIAAVTVDGSAAGASTHGRKTATYTVDKAGYVHGRTHQAPGRITIKVKGKKSESLQLVRSRHGAGKAQLLADAATLNSDDPNPVPLQRDFVLAGGTQVGQKLYVTLKRGTYFAVDTNDQSPTVAKIKQITVSGRKSNAARPYTSGTITAVRAESWAKKPKSIPHRGVLTFSNKSSEPHFIVMTRMKKGATKKDILPALTGQVPASKVFYESAENSYDSGVIGPHGSMSSTYKLPKGTYAVLCFWPDAETHMPHAFMGMIRTIKLK